jgi:hypothetical protein
MLNQLGAALDERTQRMSRDLIRRMTDEPRDEFTVEALQAAIRDLSSTRLAIAEALEEPEPPAWASFHTEFHEEERDPDCPECNDAVDFFLRYGASMPESEARVMDGNR